MDYIEKTPGCIQRALAVIGDKWTALILRDINELPKTFSQLEKSLSGISPRTLSQRLEKLQDDGVIGKTMYNAHPPRYHYGLTPKGRELQDVLGAMADWGEKYS